MIHWTRHAANYEIKPPVEGFPIAVWISPSRSADDNLVYGLTIYAGGQRILAKQFPDFETAESFVCDWFERLKEQLEDLLRLG